MPDELFRTVVSRRPRTGRRFGALPLSVALHALVIAALVVIPLFAVDVNLVPPLREVLQLTDVPAAVVPTPPPPHRPAAPRLERVESTGAPVVEPVGIRQTGLATLPPDVPSSVLSEPGGLIEGATGLPRAEFEQPPVPPAPPKPQAPLRVGKGIQPPVKIHNQVPVYPTIAIQAHVEGSVVIEALISTTGIVQEVRVVKSVPLLDDAALAAVRAWVYKPTLQNGVPVAVVMTVTVEFRLQ